MCWCFLAPPLFYIVSITVHQRYEWSTWLFDLYSGYKVIQTCEFEKLGEEPAKAAAVFNDIPTWATVITGTPPSHIAISSDSLTLSVCVLRQGLTFALMYDVRAFAAQVSILPYFNCGFNCGLLGLLIRTSQEPQLLLMCLRVPSISTLFYGKEISEDAFVKKTILSRESWNFFCTVTTI